jgi:hypothetical protein
VHRQLDGLLDFISRLGPGNQGIRLSVDMADTDTLLSEDELTLVRENLAEKVGGTLEYMALRGTCSRDVQSDKEDTLLTTGA